MRHAGGWSGKLARLVWLIERWDRVEADFAEVYGLDPIHLSGRRVLTLATQLPESARLWDHHEWGVDQELMAGIVEMLDVVAKSIARLGGVKKSKLGRALRLPRPTDPKPKTAAEKWLSWARSLRR